MHFYCPVTRLLISPSTCVFPGIGKYKGYNFDDITWMPMLELDEVVTRILQRQKYRGDRIRFIPDYKSFDLGTFFDLRKPTFPWIIVSPREPSGFLATPDSGYVATCPFRQTGLHVAAKWGTSVIQLVKKGILHFEKRNFNSQPTGVCWKGSRFKVDELSVILFKGD